MTAPSEVPIRAPQLNGQNGATSSSPSQSNATGTNGFAETSAATAPAPAAVTAASGLSNDEMALYDRQIRLWGAHAQERIRSANILLVSLRALGTEITKNLTLAGVSSLTIIDDSPVTEEDLGTQYFLREEDLGKKRAEAAIPRIQELNPRVAVKADGGIQDLLTKDQNYYAPFDCVIACDLDFMTLSVINTAARFASRPFYSAGIHGFYGYIFADLVCHEYVIERQKSNVPTTITAESMTRSVVGVSTKKENDGKVIEIVQKAEIYCPLILANTSPLPPDVLGNMRKMRGVPPLLPCLRALFEFQRAFGETPGHKTEHLAAFTQLATEKSRELQLPLETLRSGFLRSFIQNIGAEITPTAAFVGGRLSEDVINVLGKREQPIQNFALFDGDALEGRIYCLYTPPPELTMQGFDPMMQMQMDMSTEVPENMQTDMPADRPADESANGSAGMSGGRPGDMPAEVPNNNPPGNGVDVAEPEAAAETQTDAEPHEGTAGGQ